MKRRILSVLCAVATVLGMIVVPAYATDAAADSAVTLLTENAVDLTVTGDTYIDLNGYDIIGVTVEDGTLYVSDSKTDDYTVADGDFGTVTGITGSVKAAEGYLAVTEAEAVSYHRVDLSLNSMSLRPAVAGVYYNSNFAGDEKVAAQVESYGVALSVVAEPDAENIDTLCGYSVLTGFAAGKNSGSGTLLTGIMTEGNTDFANNRNASMDVYGRAYIKTAEGYVFGDCVARNLKTQVEDIDAIFASLNETQQASILAMYEKFEAVMTDWNVPNMKAAAAGSIVADTVITVPVETVNGEVLETVTVEQDGVTITVPFGALVDSNELILTVTKKAQSDSGIEAEEGQTLMPFDVHVEGISKENTEPLTVALGEVMPKNLNMGNYTIYHVEEDGTKEMTLVENDEEFDAHNQFKYDLDGNLTLNMASFSEIAALSENDNAWNGKIDYTWYDASATYFEIRNADQLAGLNKLVSGDAKIDEETVKDSFENKTVKLLSDINFKDSTWYPIGYWAPGEGTNAAGETEWYTYGGGFAGTFDGNGNTVANISQNTWALNGNYNYGYWDEAMGLFGYVVNGTVKNLTVENFYSEGEFTPTGCITAYACNSTFENIALVNCNPCVYNTGNGGIVGIGGNSDDPNEYNLIFNNITIDNSNKITALWGSWDVACGGLVGMFRGDGHVYMTNCHVAAQIDVYNDVCGNYQYYWYRYSGMLVGTNKNMTTDGNGYTVPETEKFHASGCTVHFGEWNDYYYCELVANSLASYTHDHQFSRLTEIASVSDIQDENGNWNQTGNYIIVAENKCYHIRKDAEGNFYQHDHDDYNGDGIEDYETVNGQEILVENNRCIYLPFKQLFTGYGWGVKHIPIYDDGVTPNPFDGVTILDREYANSIEKFAPVSESKEVTTYTEISLSELFSAIEGIDDPIENGNVQVTVSPADSTDPSNSVAGIYTSNTDDWTLGKLTLTGVGAAKITITDYDYCIPTTIMVTVVAGDVNDTAIEMTFESLEDDGKVSAFCPACAAAGDTALKDWYPMPVVTSQDANVDNRRLYFRDGAHHHYYLDKEVDYTQNTGYYAIAQIPDTTTGTQMCVNLNGQTVESDRRAFFTEGQTTLLNIMGDGQVTGKAFVANDNINWRGVIDGTSPINLYGGTYISGNDAPAVSMRSGSDWCTVTVHKDVSLQASAENGAQQALFLYSNSNAVMYGGTVTGGIVMRSVNAKVPNLTVSGAPVIDKVTTNGYLITVGTLTQGASITVDADGIFTDEMASAAAANAALPYFHMVPKNGYKVATHYKSLAVVQDIAPEAVLGMADLMDFSNADAETGAVTARCPACGLEAQWLPLEPITVAKADPYTEGKHHHFYLSAAKDYTGNKSFYQFSGDAACIHLNGQVLTSTARAFMSEKANSVMNIMGSGTVSGCGTYNGTIVDGVSSGVHNFFGGAVDTTATVNLYGGTFKGGDSDAIVASRGGSTRSSINVYGAQIVRTANDPAGLNVYVADNGEFNLYSGTVSGGTAVSHMEMDGLYGGNILAKAFHTNTAYPCKVNIYGGTVAGGTAETKGGNIAVMGNSYAKPTVTLNILGGNITDGSVYLSGSNAKLNLSGAPVISELDMTAGNVAAVSGLTEGADITVNAEPGVPFTAAIAENAETVAAYFASTDPQQIVVVTGDNTLIVSEGRCPHCNVATELITWTELTSSMVGTAITLTGHYYMSGDISGVAQTVVKSTADRATDLVIDLRGNSYSSKDSARCFYVRREENTTTDATLSIIDTVGGGTITGRYANGGGTLYVNSNATINMYAGTVSCEGKPYVGGAIYVIGTFNLYDGIINGTDVTANGSGSKRGGAAYVTGGTLNVYGGTINEGIADEGDCIYAMNTCKLNFYGGTVNGEIVCSTANTTVKVSGAPVVTDLKLLTGQKLTVDGELTEGASITVTADGVFTGTLADPAAVKDFFHVPEYKKIVVEGSALASAEMSICEAAASMDFTTTEADGKVTAVCPVCGEEADWYPMPAVTESRYAFATGTHYHYYLDANTDYTQNAGYYAVDDAQLCLNLNGQDIVSSARALWNEGSVTVVNIMGDGSVTGNGYWVNQDAGTYRAAIDCTAALNLYGGTYESTNAFPAVQMRSTSNTNCVLGVYEGAVIKTETCDCALEVLGISSINIYGGSVLGGSVRKGANTATLTISGNPVIEKLDLSNGQTVSVGAMTDGASIKVLAPDNVAFTEAIEANAEAYAAYFHAYELKKGVEVQDSALVITDVCPHCGVPLADIEWTLVEETKAKHTITESGHYRLAESITASSGNAISMGDATASTGLDMVLDTCGFNITSASGRSFYIGKYNHFTVFDSVGGSVCSSKATNAKLGGSGFTAYEGAVVNVYDITLNGASGANGQGNCFSVYHTSTVVNIYSGAFNSTDCTTSGNNGGTVYNHGTLNIYGGTFNDAEVTDAFGGCLYSDGSLHIENATLNGDVYIAAGTVKVAGTAVIAELQLAETMKVTVAELRNGASIAVETDAADGVFTAEGNGQYQQYFSAVDSENCWVDATANGALYVATRVLEAGFGRVSVVPTYEVKLAGGASTRMATECKDDLAVTCVALKESGEIYLVCSVDFITANSNYVSPAKKAMSAATGVPVENIIMNATHTHSSVDIRTTGWDNREQYLEDFCGWAAEAAAAAVDDLAVATVSYGSTQATDLTFVRHYLLNDGTYAGANYGDWTSGIKDHAYEADTEMQLIRFSRESKAADVVMMNFPCHATNEQTKTVMSADFPYYFRKYVEEHDTVDESGNAIAGSKDVQCAYFIAAAGDQVHSTRISGEAIVSNYQEHGEALGRYAVAVLNGGSMTAMETVGTMFVTETFTGNRNIPTEEEYNKAMAVYEIWKTLDPNGEGNASAGRGTEEGKTAALNAEFESVYQVSAIISNYEAGLKDMTNSMELRIMSLGNIGVVFAPYEMFAEQGVYIKNNSSFDMTFIVTCSEGHEGYLPSVKGWEMDSYESHVTHYERGTAEILATEFVEMLNDLKNQQ